MLSKRYQFNTKPKLVLNKIQKRSKKIVEEKIYSGEYVFETVNCIVCGSADFETLAEKDRYGLFVSTVICKTCGLVQTNPRMNQESYNKFYDSVYRSLYLGKEKATEEFFNDQLCRGGHILDFIEKNTNIKITNKVVIEIGAGAGGILQVFKEKNNEVYGLDLGSEYIEFGKKKGLNLFKGTLADFKQLNVKPDLIIYSHVLEHILNPKKELELLSTFLQKESLVYINVPGIKNLTKTYNQDLLRYLQNAHVYNFSLKTLLNLAQDVGLELISGNEDIQAIFKVGDKRNHHNNDYDEIILFLETLEERRKNPFNTYRIKHFIDESIFILLDKTGTYQIIRKLYRLVKKLKIR